MLLLNTNSHYRLCLNILNKMALWRMNTFISRRSNDEHVPGSYCGEKCQNFKTNGMYLCIYNMAKMHPLTPFQMTKILKKIKSFTHLFSFKPLKNLNTQGPTPNPIPMSSVHNIAEKYTYKMLHRALNVYQIHLLDTLILPSIGYVVCAEFTYSILAVGISQTRLCIRKYRSII